MGSFPWDVSKNGGASRPEGQDVLLPEARCLAGGGVSHFLHRPVRTVAGLHSSLA